MKMKRIISIALAAILILMLAACGGSGKSNFDNVKKYLDKEGLKYLETGNEEADDMIADMNFDVSKGKGLITDSEASEEVGFGVMYFEFTEKQDAVDMFAKGSSSATEEAGIKVESSGDYEKMSADVFGSEYGFHPQRKCSRTCYGK